MLDRHKEDLEDLYDCAREFIRRKGTVLWAGFMVDQEEGLHQAAVWLAECWLGVEEVALEEARRTKVNIMDQGEHAWTLTRWSGNGR